MSAARDIERQLAEDIARFECDPLGFILYAYPWGSGPLKGAQPRLWLVRLCGRISAVLRSNIGQPADRWRIVQQAVASGHGPGKSAAMCMLAQWALSTFERTRGIITASTDTQLRTKTWPEMIKWHSLLINRHWFEVSATAIAHRGLDREWRIDAIPWSENNTEAFAGLHNAGRRVFIGFDEASAIADRVWEVAEGAMTDAGTQCLWLVMGNPTRAGGRFRECWRAHRSEWQTETLDVRTVEGANLDRIERWRRVYGEDSEFFRVRVRGEFADADPNQLIPLAWIEAARARQAEDYGSAPRLRVSVDVADGGEDDTVITVAQHYDSGHVVLLQQAGFSFAPSVAPLESADAAERMFAAWGGRKGADDIVVDALGVGAGTAGSLMQRGHAVIAYKGGASASNPARWRNRRVQSYLVLRDAFRDGLVVIAPDALPDAEGWEEFCAQLGSVRGKPGIERLEDLVTKEEMRRAGLKSPDRADSLAMQYATSAPVVRNSAAATPVVRRSTLLEGL